MIAALTFTATAYCTGTVTRAGTTPVAGWTIAADPAVLPIGSIVWIEGQGERQVHDTGSAIKGKRLDLYTGSCREARQWGRRRVAVRVMHTPRGSR